MQEVVCIYHQMVGVTVEEFGVLVGLCHAIINKMHCIYEQIIPRMLTQEQYNDCMKINNEVIMGADNDPHFFWKIVTSDETWCVLSDP
jgi:hypothetical protein